MNAEYYTIEELETRALVPGTVARFVHSERMTVMLLEAAGDVELPEHSHPHEQITQVLEGSVVLTVEGIERTLTPGQVAVIPGNAIHSAQTLEPSRVMDIFSPVREEYR